MIDTLVAILDGIEILSNVATVAIGYAVFRHEIRLTVLEEERK